jgi:hypothetical protein
MGNDRARTTVVVAFTVRSVLSSRHDEDKAYPTTTSTSVVGREGTVTVHVVLPLAAAGESR